MTPPRPSERTASQEHFIDFCRLWGQPMPAEHDSTVTFSALRIDDHADAAAFRRPAK